MSHLITLSIIIAGALVSSAAAQETHQEAPAEPAGHFEQGVFVPAGNTLAEVREREALNRAQAEAAQRKEDENAAKIAAYDKAREVYLVEVARNEEERLAIEAQAARNAAAYDAAMALWRANVIACESGDKSRCAPSP